MRDQGIKIEQGIPMPLTSRSNHWADIIGKMQIGDSFVVPHHQAQLVRMAASKLRKRGNRNLLIVGRTGVDGVRFWRMK